MKPSCIMFRYRTTNFLYNAMIPHIMRYRFHTSCLLKASEKEDPTPALFVSGKKAETVASVVTPHLEFSRLFKNEVEFKKNIAVRGMDVDVNDMFRKWTEWKDVKDRKVEIEEKKQSVVKAIKAIQKNPKKKESLGEMKEQGRKLRDEANSLSQQIWNLEETIITPLLQLPNSLHQMTPQEDKLLFNFSEKPTFTFPPRSHRELGEITGELEFVESSPTAYYLHNNLSLLEIITTDHFLSAVRAEDYLPMCNSDFVKAAVVEGSGMHYIDRQKFNKLRGQEEKREVDPLHLVGGGSLPAFMAYDAKQMVERGDSLPQKFVTSGRNYQPQGNEHLGLFGARQCTVINGLILYGDKGALYERQILDDALILLIQAFSTIGLHFRVSQYSGQKLRMYESGAIGIEMYSPALGYYQEVGRISVIGDFISRRLWTMCRAENEKKAARFLSMMHLQFCNVTHLLGLIMENCQSENGTYAIPHHLQSSMNDFNPLGAHMD